MFGVIGNKPDVIIPQGRDFRWGAVIAPTTHNPTSGYGGYTGAPTVDDYLDKLVEAGGQAVRLYAEPNADGNLNNSSYGNMDNIFIDVITKCHQRGIHCIILLMDRIRDISYIPTENNPENINVWRVRADLDTYREGEAISTAAYATRFMERYSQYLDLSMDIIEISNEPEIFRNLQRPGVDGNPPPSGADRNHYFVNKTDTFLKHVAEVARRIREFNPNVRLATPGCVAWRQIYLMDRYVADFLHYSYLNLHWYSNQERSMRLGNFVTGVTDVTAYYVNRYNMDLIFTEFNQRGVAFNGVNDGPESGDNHQARQIRFFEIIFPKFINNPRVKYALIYQWASHPHAPHGITEETFGIWYFPGLDISLPPEDQNMKALMTPKKSFFWLKGIVNENLF